MNNDIMLLIKALVSILIELSILHKKRIPSCGILFL